MWKSYIKREKKEDNFIAKLEARWQVNELYLVSCSIQGRISLVYS